MREETPKLKILEKLGFGGFSMASNIVYQFKSIYYLFFLTNVLHIDMAVSGFILTGGIIWDAINDPLVGFYAVNHRFKNGERVRPFAFWYAIPWAVTTVLIFTNFNASKPLTVVLASVAYFFFELLNTAVAIPYNSMGGLATNRDSDRRSINVYRNIGGIVGTAIGAVSCMPLLKMFGALDKSGNLIDSQASFGFLKTAIVMGVLCILGCFVHYFTTKERILPTEDEKEEKVSLIKTFKALYSYKPFVMNTLYVLCYGIINLLLLTCLTYYCTYVMGSTSAVTLIEVGYLVSSLIMSLLVPFIDKKIGRKKTMLLGGVFYVIGKIWFIINPYSVPAIYVNAITTGIAVAITFIMFNTNRNNLSDLIEWKEGRRFDGMIGTADNLASKLGEALAAQGLTLVLALSGYDADLSVQPLSAIKAINFMLGWAPMIVGILIIVVILFLDIEKEMKKMKEGKAK